MVRKHKVLSDQYTRALNRVNVPDDLAEKVYQNMQTHSSSYTDLSQDPSGINVFDYHVTTGMPRSALILASLGLTLVIILIYMGALGEPEAGQPPATDSQIIIPISTEYVEHDPSGEGDPEDEAVNNEIELEPMPDENNGGGSFQLIIRYNDDE